MHTTTHKIINGDSRQLSELKDRNVHLMAYLYLENNTFINAYFVEGKVGGCG
ncbi:MAG: hypothetical protein LBR10_11175 [Prevotellaceae bacterium]|jgi:hypothetical protein|nr:hypothetical protein [Prevotellaceae bacterium]